MSTTDAELHERAFSCQAMLRSLAWSLRRRLPSQVETEELVSEGQVGLMRAARDFNPSAGAEFPTYAYWRMRGAMLDWIQKQPWYHPVDYHAGRLADPAAPAALTQSMSSSGDGPDMVLPDHRAVDPGQKVAEDEVRVVLREMIGRLSGLSKHILEATVLESRTLEDAGRSAGVHKGTAQRAQVRGFAELAAQIRDRGLTHIDGEELRRQVLKNASAERKASSG